MNLSEYIETLQQELAVAAEAGGEEARALAERLTAPLHSATRLVLLDALSAAADEITSELAPGSVELRLRGREPEFVVAMPSDPDLLGGGSEPASVVPEAVPPVPPELTEDDGGTARLNLRLPEALKARVEQAARREGLSLNAWLLRVAAAAVEPREPEPRPERRTSFTSDRFQGWVR